jgi:hypothetical protein
MGEREVAAPMSKAYFTVRVQLTDAALRDRFDRWYELDHLPQAAHAFGAEKAWRFWSADQAVHVAVYQFADLAAARQGTRAAILGSLVADFDATWPTGTTRSRDYLELAGAWLP